MRIRKPLTPKQRAAYNAACRKLYQFYRSRGLCGKCGGSVTVGAWCDPCRSKRGTADLRRTWLYRGLASKKQEIILRFERMELQEPETARTVLMQRLAAEYGCTYNTIGNYVGWARTPEQIKRRLVDAHEANARRGGPSFAPAKVQSLTPEQIIKNWDRIVGR